MLISVAKLAMLFDEEPGLDAPSTLTIAACLTCAGELSQGFLVGWCSLRAVSLSSEERGARACGLAFLFPFEDQRDITVGRGWRKLKEWKGRGS